MELKKGFEAGLRPKRTSNDQVESEVFDEISPIGEVKEIGEGICLGGGYRRF